MPGPVVYAMAVILGAKRRGSSHFFAINTDAGTEAGMTANALSPRIYSGVVFFVNFFVCNNSFYYFIWCRLCLLGFYGGFV